MNSPVKKNPHFASDWGLVRIAGSAAYLGGLFACGVFLAVGVAGPGLRPLGVFFAFLACFHFLEFLMTAIYHPKGITASSFLLFHSIEYVAMLVLGLVEFWLEWWLRWLVPGAWSGLSSWLLVAGACLCSCGQAVRTLAMATAAQNFTHIIADRKKSSHELVTSGVYALCRHPAYAGWFWWSVGTQLVLGNPLCTVLYAVFSWYFFYRRVEYEEKTLVNFFGDEYLQYRKRVGSGIPFVYGWQNRYRVERKRED